MFLHGICFKRIEHESYLIVFAFVNAILIHIFVNPSKIQIIKCKNFLKNKTTY